ncbi:MAG: JmjC domain-containing histone demethylation protein 1 [Pycnora praestabilis]|nr:MAG: JmjC domain-containing histone demethylation protein 1 [Pycnora praestabilis]
MSYKSFKRSPIGPPVGYRTPSPPCLAFEPISPISPHEPRVPTLFESTRGNNNHYGRDTTGNEEILRTEDDTESEDQVMGFATDDVQGREPTPRQAKRGELATTMDALATVALATSPTFAQAARQLPHLGSFSPQRAPRPRNDGSIPLAPQQTYNYPRVEDERPSKRARSEAFPSPKGYRTTPRPASSHVPPTLWSPNTPWATQPVQYHESNPISASPSSNSMSTDAELLLNLARATTFSPEIRVVHGSPPIPQHTEHVRLHEALSIQDQLPSKQELHTTGIHHESITLDLPLIRDHSIEPLDVEDRDMVGNDLRDNENILSSEHSIHIEDDSEHFTPACASLLVESDQKRTLQNARIAKHPENADVEMQQAGKELSEMTSDLQSHNGAQDFDSYQANDNQQQRTTRGWPKGKPRGPRSSWPLKAKNSPSSKLGRRAQRILNHKGKAHEDRQSDAGKPKCSLEELSANQHAGHGRSPRLVPSVEDLTKGSSQRSRRFSESHTASRLPSSSTNSVNNHEVQLAKRASSVPTRFYHAKDLSGASQTRIKSALLRRNGSKQAATCAGCNFARNNSLDGENEADATSWISCDGCKRWFHFACAGFKSEREVRSVDKYNCRECRPRCGPTTFVRKSTRAHTAIDYAGLNEGVVKTSDENNEHHYIKPIKEGTITFLPENFPRMRPELVTAEFFEKGDGMKEPIVIPAWMNPRPDTTWIADSLPVPGIDPLKNAPRLVPTQAPANGGIPNPRSHWTPDVGQDALDMVVPQGLTVRRVAALYGPDERVEVIDVKSQEGEDKKWNMRKWADYYESQGEKVVRNVISLEVSRTKLGKLIKRPQVVRELDLQDSVWPIEAGDHPRVQFYCLMSVADCFTDFHIDFGGSSVFYHILKGKKTFLFIPPKNKHLKKYEEWCMSPAQNWTFLPDQTKECYRVDLSEGDTMLIPSGWIHAVWTPENSLVIGGNFLTRMHYSMQIRIAEIEKATKVGRKFRYPHFQKILWYTAIKYLEDDPLPANILQTLYGGGKFYREIPAYYEFSRSGKDPKAGLENYHTRYYSQYELQGLPDLARYLLRTALISMGKIVDGITVETRNAVTRSIPKTHGEPLDIVKKFALWSAWKRGNELIPHWAYPDSIPGDGIAGSGEKKLSATAAKRAEREAAIEAYRVAPERQSARKQSQTEAASLKSTEESVKSASPTVGSPVTENPKVTTSTSRPGSGFIDSEHVLGKRKASGTGLRQTPARSHQATNGNPLSTPKSSVLGPKRVACNACRKRRVRCEHKGDADLAPNQGRAKIDKEASSTLEQPIGYSESPTSSKPGKQSSDDLLVVQAALDDYQSSQTKVASRTRVGQGIVAGEQSKAGRKERIRQRQSSLTKLSMGILNPLETTDKSNSISLAIPHQIDSPSHITTSNGLLRSGVPHVVDDSPGNKRARSRACNDCRKSKRRCIHDENGNIDPIKAQEAAIPRPSGAYKRQRPSDAEINRDVVKKSKKGISNAELDYDNADSRLINPTSETPTFITPESSNEIISPAHESVAGVSTGIGDLGATVEQFDFQSDDHTIVLQHEDDDSEHVVQLEVGPSIMRRPTQTPPTDVEDGHVKSATEDFRSKEVKQLTLVTWTESANDEQDQQGDVAEDEIQLVETSPAPANHSGGAFTADVQSMAVMEPKLEPLQSEELSLQEASDGHVDMSISAQLPSIEQVEVPIANLQHDNALPKSEGSQVVEEPVTPPTSPLTDLESSISPFSEMEDDFECTKESSRRSSRQSKQVQLYSMETVKGGFSSSSTTTTTKHSRRLPSITPALVTNGKSASPEMHVQARLPSKMFSRKSDHLPSDIVSRDMKNACNMGVNNGYLPKGKHPATSNGDQVKGRSCSAEALVDEAESLRLARELAELDFGLRRRS